MKRLLLLFLVGCAGPQAAAGGRCDLDGLAWLSGRWVASEGEALVEESWSEPRARTMLGTSRTMAGGDTVFFEFLRVVESDDGIRYVASPKGEGQTSFEMVSCGGGAVTFENMEHDFPQRITYRREGEALHARIEGVENGAPRTAEWTFRR